VRSDEAGRPHVSGPWSDDVRVSIAHTDGIAVALAAEGMAPGVDVEPIEARGDGFAAMAFGDEELTLVRSGARDEWLTRVWCAKEAAGKARGTGLGGAPRSLRVERVEGERMLVDRLLVDTRVLDGHVIAWTEGST